MQSFIVAVIVLMTLKYVFVPVLSQLFN